MMLSHRRRRRTRGLASQLRIHQPQQAASSGPPAAHLKRLEKRKMILYSPRKKMTHRGDTRQTWAGSTQAPTVRCFLLLAGEKRWRSCEASLIDSDERFPQLDKLPFAASATGCRRHSRFQSEFGREMGKCTKSVTLLFLHPREEPSSQRY